MAIGRMLPEGFDELEAWVPHWAKITEQERRKQRDRSSLEEIKAFYDAMIKWADPALEYLNKKDIGAFDESEDRLFALTLSLAEIAAPVEWYNQVRVIDGIVPERYEIDDTIRRRFAREKWEEKWS